MNNHFWKKIILLRSKRYGLFLDLSLLLKQENAKWMCWYRNSLLFLLLPMLYKFGNFYTLQPTLAILMTDIRNTQLDRWAKRTYRRGEVPGVALARYRINVKTMLGRWFIPSHVQTYNLRLAIGHRRIGSPLIKKKEKKRKDMFNLLYK